jgi:plastocyanin
VHKFVAGALATFAAVFLMTGCAGDDASAGVTVEAREMKFTPRALTVHPGRQVITVHNAGELRHTFSINSLGSEVTVNPGATKSITVDLEPGTTYRYVCRVLDHEGLGMRGALRVRDK